MAKNSTKPTDDVADERLPTDPMDLDEDMGPEDDADDEFDAGWNEGAAEPVAAAQTAEPEKDPPVSVASETDGQSSGETRSEADTGGQDAGEDLEPSAAGGEGAVSESQDAVGPTDEEPENVSGTRKGAGDAPASTASPDLDALKREISELRKSLHDQRSESGRLRSFVRERDERIQALEGSQQGGAGGATPAVTQEDQAALDKKVQTYREELDPEAAEVFDILLDRAKREVVDQLTQQMAPRIDSLEQTYVQAQAQTATDQGVALLNERFGTDSWMDEYRAGRVDQWASGQPPGVKAMLESDHPADAAVVLDMYYRDHPDRLPARSNGQSATANPQPADAPPPTVARAAVAAKPQAEDNRTAARRRSQLRGAAATPRNTGGGAPRSGVDTDTDFDAGWNEGALRHTA